MTAREALRLATRGGAAGPRARDDIGAIESGQAVPTSQCGPRSGLELAGSDDPVAALVLAGPAARRPPSRGRRGGRPRRPPPARGRRRDREARTACRQSGLRPPSDPAQTIDLDARSRYRPAAEPARGRAGGALPRPRRSCPQHETDGDGRIADLPGRELEAGAYRLVFHPPSPFFCACARARDPRRRPGAPLPRAAPRLPVLVRELPRKLSRERARRALRAATRRWCDRLAGVEDPLVVARTVAGELTEARTARGARRPSGDRGPRPLGHARRGSRAPDDDPVRARGARGTQQGVRGGVRLSLRRLRRPAGLAPRSFRCCASASAAHARRSSRPALDELVAIAHDRWQRA